MRPALVVMGGSLGATEACARVLRELPAGFPLPIALVLHRWAAATEDLADVLGAKIRLAVREVLDRDEIRPGRVHLAPAGYHLLVAGERFALSTEPAVNGSRPSIDVLFESAAEARGAALMAVVLTGSSSDGAAGAGRVTSLGGRVLVEDPASARAPAMPRAAIQAARACQVLSLEKIAQALVAAAGGGGEER